VARAYMNFDLVAAWYAVSLVPKNVVVGHAARVAISRLGFVLVISIVYLVSYLVVKSLYDQVSQIGRLQSEPEAREAAPSEIAVRGRGPGRDESHPNSVSLAKRTTLVITLLVALVVAFTALGGLFWLMLHIIADEYSLSSSPYAHIALVMNGLILLVGPVLLWLYLIDDAIHHGAIGNRSFWIPHVSNWRRLLAATLIYLIVAYTGILAAAIFAPPPLPHAYIYKSSGRQEVSGNLVATGKLLTHADGFWYIFVKQTGGVTLRAISDDNVDQVKVTSRSDWRSDHSRASVPMAGTSNRERSRAALTRTLRRRALEKRQTPIRVGENPPKGVFQVAFSSSYAGPSVCTRPRNGTRGGVGGVRVARLLLEVRSA
jgi:hypothetical protein